MHIYILCGPGSSVSIAIDYLAGGNETFRPPRPGPTQPHVQWVPGLSRG